VSEYDYQGAKIIGPLTDEDLEAIERIVEEGTRRTHGEALLHTIEGADERKQETTRSLLDTIARARLAQETQEGGQE
jgi:hypothetical protein